MIPLAILIFGLLLVLVLAMVILIASGVTPLIVWVLPAVPLMVMMGSGGLMLIEALLFFGGKDDRRVAKRDFGLLFPTFVLSALLWYVSAFLLGLWK